MHDGLWYGITVQLMETILSTYYGAINRVPMIAIGIGIGIAIAKLFENV
jgi:hypothetical protein